MRAAPQLPLVTNMAGRVGLQELVVLSGKGGTGKTSVLASFAVLAEGAVLADCDVDAADLHLVLDPQVEMTTPYESGQEAVIRAQDCDGCGVCLDLCRFDAVCRDGSAGCHIDEIACEGCGVCARFCPAGAVDMVQRSCGEWYRSRTRCGPMVHARLAIAAESSGKLVTVVRNEARRVAEQAGSRLILVDGPPGIGCPVIASLTGASAVLLVAEPTCSGAHDLERVLSLTRHFMMPAAVCVNRWDLNPSQTEHIEHLARQRGAPVLGRIRYDPAVTRAQVEAQTVVEHNGGPAADDIRALWRVVHDEWLSGALRAPRNDRPRGGLVS